MPAIETRAGGKIEAQGNKVIGYAAVFGPLSENLGGFRERVAPTAFDRTLAGEKDVRALMDHDTAKVLGRRANGTLGLSTDKNGLRVEIELPNTTYANDLRELLARGDVSQMSFAFLVNDGGDQWEGKTEDGLRLRTLLDVELVEVSLVAIPAYPDTSAALRSLQRNNQQAKQRQMWLVKNRLSPRWGKA